MTRGRWLLLAALVAVVVTFGLRAHHQGEAPPVVAEAPPEAAAPEAAAPEAAAPYTRRSFPAQGGQVEEPREPPVPATVPPGAYVPKHTGLRGGQKPPPPPTHQTAATWATSYAAAMCACVTRQCTRDLQGHFIHELGGVEYDEGRDGTTYTLAVNKASDCYNALPAD
jgi:hypothetical protein